MTSSIALASQTNNLQVFVPEYTGQKDNRVFISGMQNTDPEVLISSVRKNYPVQSFYAVNKVRSIRDIDAVVRSIVYDSKAKTIKETKTPEQVLSTNLGNCYEIAFLAKHMLEKVGYTTQLVNIKSGSSQTWHTICVFKEIDGTLSVFQSSGDQFSGYMKGNSTTLQGLLNSVFSNVYDYEVLN